MSALVGLLKEIDEVRALGRADYPQTPMPMNPPAGYRFGWLAVARETRIALAALRRIKRVGNQGTCRTEESEIATAALRRIEGKKPKRKS